MASKVIHVWPETPREVGEVIEVKAKVEWPGVGENLIWFRLPSQHVHAITESADPFVLASLFRAMHHGHRLYVHGQVSSILLRNLEEFQIAWARWWPDRYRAVEIVADSEVDIPVTGGDKALLAFSGGLDSCFSACRHTRGDCGRSRRNLAAGVMVHGFDIPLHQVDVFDRAAENSRKILESVGLQLIPITCNLRKPEIDWRDAHGAAIASCLHLLSGGYATGLIAGSHAYDALRFPWGSNPLTDPMLSSAAFSIVYDAGGYSRREKARGIAKWTEAMRRVRVCWEGPHLDRNCGQCVRCVATALCFAVEGLQPADSLQVHALERAVEDLAHRPLRPIELLRLQELLDSAPASCAKEPWANALDDLIRARNRRGRLERVLPLLALPRRLRRSLTKRLYRTAVWRY